MPRKPKFKPVLTRIELNPEQAVLTCDCFSNASKRLEGGGWLGRSSDRVLICIKNWPNNGDFHAIECLYTTRTGGADWAGCVPVGGSTTS